MCVCVCKCVCVCVCECVCIRVCVSQQMLPQINMADSPKRPICGLHIRTDYTCVLYMCTAEACIHMFYVCVIYMYGKGQYTCVLCMYGFPADLHIHYNKIDM